MELYTLTRNMRNNVVIDGFNSVIWTERYYGDGDFELVVPYSREMVEATIPGTLIRLEGSPEIMIIETRTFENGLIKIQGIGLLLWFNNRVVRRTGSHVERYWNLTKSCVGEVLWYVIRQYCWDSYPGNYEAYIPGIEQAMIPGLTLKEFDRYGGGPISIAVPYGPLYDAIRGIAVTYEMGMQLLLEWTTAHPEIYTNFEGNMYPKPNPPTADYFLAFRCWKGQDRTSNQSVYPVVRFSPETDSLSNIKEVQSASQMKTLVVVYAPSNPGDLTEYIASGSTLIQDTLSPGYSSLGLAHSGFDCRVLEVLADDITTDQVGKSQAKLLALLNERAKLAIASNTFVQAVDGQIVKDIQFKYGVDYNLGDLVEVEGTSRAVSRARVTEYIRSQDSAGVKEYPTLSALTS